MTSGLNIPLKPRAAEPSTPAGQEMSPLHFMMFQYMIYYIPQQQVAGLPQLQDPEGWLPPKSCRPCEAMYDMQLEHCTLLLLHMTRVQSSSCNLSRHAG